MHVCVVRSEIVESVSADPRFEGGPDLPQPIAKHCLVRMTQSKVRNGRFQKSIAFLKLMRHVLFLRSC